MHYIAATACLYLNVTLLSVQCEYSWRVVYGRPAKWVLWSSWVLWSVRKSGIKLYITFHRNSFTAKYYLLFFSPTSTKPQALNTVLSKVWLQRYLIGVKSVDEGDRISPLDSCLSWKMNSLGTPVINLARLSISSTSSTAQYKYQYYYSYSFVAIVCIPTETYVIQRLFGVTCRQAAEQPVQ